MIGKVIHNGLDVAFGLETEVLTFQAERSFEAISDLLTAASDFRFASDNESLG